MAEYIWYVGYGSNLDEQRLRCYVENEIPDFSLMKEKPRKEIENIAFLIPYRLFFSWPYKKSESENWGEGSVAFLDPQESKNKSEWSCGRAWKITLKQYNRLKEDEGKFYQKEIQLEEVKGIRSCTFTYCPNDEAAVNKGIKNPSDRYLKTIARGLRETFSFDADAFVNYLKDKEGVRGNINEEKLREIFISIKDL